MKRSEVKAIIDAAAEDTGGALTPSVIRAMNVAFHHIEGLMDLWEACEVLSETDGRMADGIFRSLSKLREIPE